MEAEGIVRSIDQQGRVVIPMEMRKRYGIELGDPIEFFTDDRSIILKKYHPSCVFCGEVKDTISFQGQLICPNCLAALKKTKDKKK